DVALQEVVETHLASGAAVTMTVTAGDPRYGGVMAGPDGIVRGFAPPGFVPALPGSASAAGERFHFVGIQAVEVRVFEALRDDEPSETVRGIYPQMAAGQPGSIRTYRTAQPFYDIGTPADYLATAHAFGRADQHGNLRGRDV